MTMEKISSSVSPTTKRMCEMVRGEVCRIVGDERYVLNVTRTGQNSIFLILNDHSATNTFGSNCTQEVRELARDESITIKFS